MVQNFRGQKQGKKKKKGAIKFAGGKVQGNFNILNVRYAETSRVLAIKN